MPLFMAWVLSCLILSASFQSGQINNEVEVSQQSPLAQFNYAGKSYSLRFTGTKLENSDDQGDGPEAIVELTLGFLSGYCAVFGYGKCCTPCSQTLPPTFSRPTFIPELILFLP